MRHWRSASLSDRQGLWRASIPELRLRSAEDLEETLTLFRLGVTGLACGFAKMDQVEGVLRREAGDLRNVVWRAVRLGARLPADRRDYALRHARSERSSGVSFWSVPVPIVAGFGASCLSD